MSEASLSGKAGLAELREQLSQRALGYASAESRLTPSVAPQLTVAPD
jgi:hypothetical protein